MDEETPESNEDRERFEGIHDSEAWAHRSGCALAVAFVVLAFVLR